MATLVRVYENLTNIYPDPRVKTWKLMDSPFPTLTIIAVYLSLVLVLLPAYMKNRKPYNLTTLIRYYNIFQIISCISLIYMIATSGYTQGELSLGCEPIDYSNKPMAVKMLTAFYWLYILKMIELVETIFFILRKKFNQVTGLHIYHHASTFALSYIGCKFIGGGMASIPVMLNSFIHILMYTYYYLSSLGPQWQKTLAPWKPKLTMAQMIQFTLLILHSIQALPTSCNVPKLFLVIYVPNVIVIFKMFYDFYTASYNSKNKEMETNTKKLKAT